MKLRGVTLPTAPLDASVAAKLLEATPQQNEEKLGHYLARCGVFSLTENYDHDMSETHVWCGSMSTPEGQRVFWFPKTSTKPLEPIAEVLRRACAPLPRRDLIKALGKVMTLCRNKTLDEDETVLTLEMYAEKLNEYPADAVAWALEIWPEDHIFWPSWAEIKALVQAKSWQRLRMRALIERQIQCMK